uniref:Cytochrome P450 oxidase CYP74B29 n=1 Tax=Polygala tenuifolia TaxID=355332 RepID=A0A3G5ANG3_9FABA|nr:cytochrome P450 oxidase CYP74B29 [Polygala tenuifolia]
MSAIMMRMPVISMSSTSQSPKFISPSYNSPAALPVRSLPGSYGWPLLGPISDRLDYFWFQGPETFFRKRMDKYKSTVFRTNVPPCFPFFTGVNPNVIAVLDCKSFANLFDMEVIEKKDVLVGDFMPSLKFTGDMRPGVYQDISEPEHSKVKNFSIDILKRSSKLWASELASNLDIMWDEIETSLSKSSSASFLIPLQKSMFRFLSKCLVGADPLNDPDVAESGYAMLDKWLALQLLPTIKIGVLQPLEEIFLHSFAYPFFLVSGDYQKLYYFLEKQGQEVIRRGETEFGLGKEATIHNLLFIMGFNAFGGFSVFLPSLINIIGSDKTGLQEKLRKEVREKGGSTLSFASVKEMELVQSVVYETLRLNPPVPLQFGRARKDFQLSSHESSYDIKKGELLCGYQPLVMRDSKVFEDPERFIPDRFTEEKDGNELLNYLYWSNGPQTGIPNQFNKQCSAKDYVTMTASLFVAHLFSRYDSIKGDSTSISGISKAK